MPNHARRMTNDYHLAILGGGPAGAAAGVYAARKQLKSVLVTKEWGGQSVVSPEIQNWIGTVTISGDELAKALKGHVKAYAGDIIDIREGKCATKVKRGTDGFEITIGDEDTVSASAVLLCVGARRRKLPVPGADTFEHKGLTYCASCDGPLFADMDVVVIGGGNAGFETAQQLLAYTKSVTLLHRSEEFKADPVTVEKVLAHKNMIAMKNTEPTEILGEQFVSGVKYKNTKTGEEGHLDVTGVFVEIGLIPNTELVADLVELDEIKRIKIDPTNGRTSREGIWAAGDCTDVRYHQNNIAAGDAIRALENIYAWC